MPNTELLLSRLATACGTGIGVYGIVDGAKNLIQGKSDRETTLFLGLSVLGEMVTSYGLVSSGTMRERTAALLYLLTDSVALILSLLSLANEKETGGKGRKDEETRSIGNESLYSLIVVVAVLAGLLCWRLGSAVYSATKQTKRHGNTNQKEETTSPVYWAGLLLTIAWLGTGIWNGAKNVSRREANVSLTILLSLSFTASLLRLPLLFSDLATRRERITFFFMILLEGAGMFLNVYAFDTPPAYAAAFSIVLAVVIVDVLLARKLGVGRLSSLIESRREGKQK